MPSSKTRSGLSLLDAANWLGAVLCALLLTVFLLTRVWAAPAPTGGTITPSTAAALTFHDNLTGTGATSAEGADTCTPDVNCEFYTLTVAPGDYTGKQIAVKIQWSVETNDYDLFIHQGGSTGPIVAQSANGAPQTSEQTVIDPGGVVSTAQTYTIQVNSFAAASPTDEPTGTIAIAAVPPPAPSNHIVGDMTFSPNVSVKAPVSSADGEPSSRTDLKGNFYVSGIRGVPAGVDLWYTNVLSDPLMRGMHWQGQPDSFTGSAALSVGADGGGDVDLAVTLPTDGTLPTLAASSLVAANLSFINTLNPNKTTGTGGSPTAADAQPTYNLNPVGNTAGGADVDDRQWMAAYGKSVYILYRTISEPPVAFIQRSDPAPTATGTGADAAGFVYGPATVIGTSDQTGGLDVDQSDGTVYACFNDGRVAVGVPPLTGGAPLTYTFYQAASDPNGVAHIFCTVKVSQSDHVVYVVYSNEKNIFLVYSKDHGKTWSQPLRVNALPTDAGFGADTTVTNVFPWLATGPTPGSVGICWYGTTDPLNDSNANWKVYYAQTFNALGAAPTFSQVTASDHFIHASNISEGGTTGTANRNLLDYFQVSYDPNGAAVIGYTDDHNDFNGHTFVMHQIGGTSISGKALTAPPMLPASSGPTLTPGPLAGTPAGTLPGAQVLDYAGDVSAVLLASINGGAPNPNPGAGTGTLTLTPAVDILSINYSSVKSAHGPTVVATMQLASLANFPAGGATYRMNFTANAPFATISPTGDYSFGLPDRGDQFYVQATVSATGVPSYTYGTTVRGSDGSLTNTAVGTADSGAFDTAHGTVTVRVSSAKLNALIKNGTDALGVVHNPVASGSVLAGLRGAAFGAGTSAVVGDETRGGTQYAIP